MCTKSTQRKNMEKAQLTTQQLYFERVQIKLALALLHPPSGPLVLLLLSLLPFVLQALLLGLALFLRDSLSVKSRAGFFPLAHSGVLEGQPCSRGVVVFLVLLAHAH